MGPQDVDPDLLEVSKKHKEMRRVKTTEMILIDGITEAMTELLSGMTLPEPILRKSCKEAALALAETLNEYTKRNRVDF